MAILKAIIERFTELIKLAKNYDEVSDKARQSSHEWLVMGSKGIENQIQLSRFMGEFFNDWLDNFDNMSKAQENELPKIQQFYEDWARTIENLRQKMLEVIRTSEEMVHNLIMGARISPTLQRQEQLNYLEKLKGQIDDLRESNARLDKAILSNTSRAQISGRLAARFFATGLKTEENIKNYNYWADIAQDSDKEIVRLKGEQLDNLKKIQTVMQSIAQIEDWLLRNSDSLGEAFRRIRIELEETLEGINDIFAKGLFEAFKKVGTGLIDELLFGETADSLTDQIADLRANLAQIRAERQGVLIVEDEEAEILERINELEERRANIVLTKIREAAMDLAKTLETLAMDMLAKEILSAIFPPEEDVQQLLALEGQISAAKAIGAEALLVGSMADLELAKQRLDKELAIAAVKSGASLLPFAFGALGIGSIGELPIPTMPPIKDFPLPPLSTVPGGGERIQINFNAPVYGTDDFDRRIDQSLHKLRRVVR